MSIVKTRDAASGSVEGMDRDYPPLIRALLQSRRYPHPVAGVSLVQTHISWVLLAGDFAYKIKKPIKLPFLDFSTLARRKICCDDELRLNRRFAPDLYLDVVAITGTPEDPNWGGTDEPIEYAVRMRRFDEGKRLDRVCARGELTSAHVSDLAGLVAAFHERAATAPASSQFGAPQEVRAQALDNFRDLARLLPDERIRERLEHLRAWTEAQSSQLAPVMAARKAAGRVRECHGDLHLANLVLIDGQVRMFDCIEFNEDLRFIDVASEIAFTYIDLLDHGEPGLAIWFVNEILGQSGDYEAAQVLRFYAVYRALVRAKVEAIRSSQIHDEGGEALTYLALAEHLIAPALLHLTITHGLAGCGKTVASSQVLLGDLHAATLRLRSDVERKRLFGMTSAAQSGSGLDSGIYSPEAHARTYECLHDHAQMLLRAGWSVIVDAAFLQRADRARFQALAQATGAGFRIVAPNATPAQLRERILARSDLASDASEATVEVLKLQMARIEPLDATEQSFLFDAGAVTSIPVP